MSDHTGIEYLRDRNDVLGATWNPTTGCEAVSEGCNNCWARGVAETRMRTSFAPTVHQDRLAIPLHWKRPRNIAVSFMGDLFHDAIPEAFIAAVWGVMSMAEHHTFVVCTKRPARARTLLSQPDWHARMIEAMAIVPDDAARLVSLFGRAHKPRQGALPLPNIVFLFSAETQQRFDERVEDALAVPAAVHGVSLEPLLGPVNMLYGAFDGSESFSAMGRLGFVALGCESGPHRRPMLDRWARDIRDQCQSARVPFFLKQAEGVSGRVEKLPLLDGRQWTERPEVML